MRISDWSSDVCSSDLGEAAHQQARPVRRLQSRMRDADAAREYAVDAEAEQISAQHIVIGHQSRKAAGNYQHGTAVIADGAQVSGHPLEEGGRRMRRYGSDSIGHAERSEERREGKAGVRTGRTGWAQY